MKLMYWLNCLLLAGLAFGQDTQRAGVPTVRAHGEATINVKPDLAQLNVGVVTQGQTADSAAGQNAKQTAEVISALKRNSELELKYRHPGIPSTRIIEIRVTEALLRRSQVIRRRIPSTSSCRTSLP